MTTQRGSSASQTRIAVIDSDTGFLQVLGNRLDRMGWAYRVLGSATPIEELVAMRLTTLVVDPTVIGSHAAEYLEKVCAEIPTLGVIICTGQSTVAQRVRGLRLGADDWLTKPCHPEELIARIEAITRRRERMMVSGTTEATSFGELEIRSDRFQVYVNGVSADLTRREYELLALLSSADERVLEREEIYQRVWGYAMAHGDRSVDVFVRKLRQKLEKASPDWVYLHTHFGVGYRFAAERVDGLVPAPVVDVPVAKVDAAVAADLLATV